MQVDMNIHRNAGDNQNHEVMQGVVNGCFTGQHARVDELNSRMQERQFPSNANNSSSSSSNGNYTNYTSGDAYEDHRPNFSARAVGTRYSLFGQRPACSASSEPRPAPTAVPSEPTRMLCAQQPTFHPSSHNGPALAFRANVNTETMLRNQYIALQHGAEQGVYVPAETSDLYMSRMAAGTYTDAHASLFAAPQFQQPTAAVASQPIGKALFNNHSRTQLRNLSE